MQVDTRNPRIGPGPAKRCAPARRSGVLLSALLIGVVLSACGTSHTPHPHHLDLDVDAWTGNVHGMTVSYQIVSRLTDSEGNPIDGEAFMSMSGVRGDLCHFQWNRSYLPEGNISHRIYAITAVARLTARCFDELLMGMDHNGFATIELYSEAWSALYMDRCGIVLAPLSWPVNDGDCLPPEPRAPLPGASVATDTTH